MAVQVTVFDGAGCIGGNKIHLAFDGHGIFLDFGLNYKRLSQFYEEFLRPRTTRGIHDFLQMGLIPNIDCYRQDLIPSDLMMSSATCIEVDAVFLSHAHMDHAGSASFLDTSIPFITTSTTAALLKAMKETAVSGFENESVYSSIRVPSEDDPRVIKQKGSLIGRDLFLTCQCNNDFQEFWSHCPATKGIVPGNLDTYESIGFDCQCFDVDHSIYGAAACAVNTSAGWVVYSGDLRTHGMFKEKTEEFVKKAKGLNPRLLIVEGTRASREDREESEKEVFDNCLTATQEEKKLVIADFSPRNFERLDTFTEIAKRTGRQLVVLAKDAYLLDALRCSDGKDRVQDLLIYGDLKTRYNGWEKEIWDKHSNLAVDPFEISKATEQYILCLSFWDMGKLLDIRPKGGTYIYSSSEAYSEDQVIDFQRLSSWLDMFNFSVRGFKLIEENGRESPKQERGFHASGHISSGALLEMIERIEPEIVMPVHTELPEFFENLDGIQTLIPSQGCTYDIK